MKSAKLIFLNILQTTSIKNKITLIDVAFLGYLVHSIVASIKDRSMQIIIMEKIPIPLGYGLLFTQGRKLRGKNEGNVKQLFRPNRSGNVNENANLITTFWSQIKGTFLKEQDVSE